MLAHQRVKFLSTGCSYRGEACNADRPKVLNGAEGTIVTHKFLKSGYYPPNSRCQWRVVLPDASQVRISKNVIRSNLQADCIEKNLVEIPVKISSLSNR